MSYVVCYMTLVHYKCAYRFCVKCILRADNYNTTTVIILEILSHEFDTGLHGMRTMSPILLVGDLFPE